MTMSSLLLLVISTAIVSLALTQTCPYTDPNCRCQDKTVICGNLDRVPLLQTGINVIAVDTLRFEKGGITSIPDNSLPPDLVSIYIGQNPLSNISDGAFRDSATTLKYLFFYSARFTRVPDAFTNLTDLRNLTFKVVDINEWNSAALSNIEKSLMYLNLVMVDLSIWPDWISRCQSLNGLRIFYGNITSIPETAFTIMSNTLTSLEIEMSGLSRVPEALNSLRNLTTLDLSQNILDDVNGRPGLQEIMKFPLAKTLKQLKVWNTFITQLPNLSNASSLVHLDFLINDISHVTSDLLPRSLVFLSLTANKITKITDASFTGLSKLEILYLGDNPITEVSSLAFKDLVSLRILELSRTKLTQIPLSMVSLSSLESLLMNDVPSLECPCPPSTDLKTWYQSSNGTLSIAGVCCRQESIALYLSGTCTAQPPCSKDGASILMCSMECSYVSLLLLLTTYLYHL